MKKTKVGILGCTGAVGQKFITLLSGHPWFELAEIAASENSAGKIYGECASWKEVSPIPDAIKEMRIKSCSEDLDARILFSGLDSSVACEVEAFHAKKGRIVVSNSKNYRMDADVPLVIPEINADHLALAAKQREKYPKGGFIVTNPNCAIIVAALALFPIYKRLGLNSVLITTMQAISGAGYPGVPSMDILGNVIPHIRDEEEKMQTEILKIFGALKDGGVEFANFKISAMCNRVPVYNGHTMAISFSTIKKAGKEDIIKLFSDYEGLQLPSSPQKIVQYFADPFRPQPLLDLNAGNGMTVSIGNLRKCSVLDWKMAAFGHNTVRGAAGAAILNAEYIVKMAN